MSWRYHDIYLKNARFQRQAKIYEYIKNLYYLLYIYELRILISRNIAVVVYRRSKVAKRSAPNLRGRCLPLDTYEFSDVF